MVEFPKKGSMVGPLQSLGPLFIIQWDNINVEEMEQYDVEGLAFANGWKTAEGQEAQHPLQTVEGVEVVEEQKAMVGVATIERLQAVL